MDPLRFGTSPCDALLSSVDVVGPEVVAWVSVVVVVDSEADRAVGTEV